MSEYKYSSSFHLSNFKHIHFIGIGGISMSALAKICLNRGISVSGSDRAKSNLTEELSHLGAQIYYKHQSKNVTGADLVVYTCAVGENNVEVKFARQNGIVVFERSELLAEITKEYHTVIAVAGSHGKTTVCGLLGAVLTEAKKRPTILVGGETPFGNLILGKKHFLIVEACEYREHFLKLNHDIAAILNIDYDHPDFFKTKENYEKSFKKFANFSKKQVFIDEKYEMNDILQNGKDINVENGKDILNEIEEIKLRNTILQKEIAQLETENMNLKNIKDIIINNVYNNNSNAYNDDLSKYEYEEEIIGKNIKEYENKNEQFIKQVYDLKNEIELKNNIIDELKNEINDINKNIIEIENKKNIKNEYFILRNKNEDNLKKLNALNEEIKKLLLSKEQYINEYDNQIKKLNELYNDKKEKIFIESIDNETRTLIEENEKIKNENDSIIQSLNDLQDLNNEYEKLNQINAKLKEELNKIQQK